MFYESSIFPVFDFYSRALIADFESALNIFVDEGIASKAVNLLEQLIWKKASNCFHHILVLSQFNRFRIEEVGRGVTAGIMFPNNSVH